MMKVKEVADLIGISVRTLHHYDVIGLLKPGKTGDAGYRSYDDKHLDTLQQILFFKELGFPLKEIKRIIHDPKYDREHAYVLHKQMLLDKRRRIDRMLATLDKTIDAVKGGYEMSNQEKFKGFDFTRNPYEEEARKKWGNKQVAQSKARLDKLSQDEQQAMSREMNACYSKLASLRDQSPASEEAQAAIAEWYVLLNRMGDYSLETFKGLGQLYVDDERFTKNIDQFGEGLALFMRDAMAVYTDQRMGK